MAGGNVRAKKSDLGVRVVSAAVMLAVAGVALWVGGVLWAAFVMLVAMGVLWEWRRLVGAFEPDPVQRGLWNTGGIVYIGIAAAMLLVLRSELFGIGAVLCILAMVIATDVGAYFAGRAIGGPKIAPAISPSKTWAGLGGGIVGASLAYAAYGQFTGEIHTVSPTSAIALSLGSGAITAVVAQVGDFFESWMKRKAGVKDSGRLIPGHGGLFDRADGLMAVLFVLGVLMMIRSALAL